jgi:hypothetical protein
MDDISPHLNSPPSTPSLSIHRTSFTLSPCRIITYIYITLSALTYLSCFFSLSSICIPLLSFIVCIVLSSLCGPVIIHLFRSSRQCLSGFIISFVIRSVFYYLFFFLPLQSSVLVNLPLIIDYDVFIFCG